MSVPPSMTPAILTSAIATANPKARPAAQPQETARAIHRASTAAMIAPRPHTALGSVSSPGALRQSNYKPSKRRWAAMPARLNVRIAEPGLLLKEADGQSSPARSDRSRSCALHATKASGQPDLPNPPLRRTTRDEAGLDSHDRRHDRNRANDSRRSPTDSDTRWRCEAPLPNCSTASSATGATSNRQVIRRRLAPVEQCSEERCARSQRVVTQSVGVGSSRSSRDRVRPPAPHARPDLQDWMKPGLVRLVRMERLVRVEFGPSRSKRFGQAPAEARGGVASAASPSRPGTGRASFSARIRPRTPAWPACWSVFVIGRATEVYEDDELVSV